MNQPWPYSMSMAPWLHGAGSTASWVRGHGRGVAARDAGIQRYVMVSYFGAGPDHGVPGDNSFLAWTILAPSTLTLAEGTGRIETGPELQGTEVPRQDVARVAAGVLDRPGTAGKTIAFNTGGTPIDRVLDALT